MSVKFPSLAHSYSHPLFQQPAPNPFMSTRATAVSPPRVQGCATPGGAVRAVASYAAPASPCYSPMNTYDATMGAGPSAPPMTYAAPPPPVSSPNAGSARQTSTRQVRPAMQRTQSPLSSSRRAFQVEAQLSPSCSPSPMYASPSCCPSPVYASSPPASLTYMSAPRMQEQLFVEPNGQIDRVMTYAAPVQEVVEIIKDDAEANALRAELQECVALVQDYQRKNAELSNIRNGLDMSLSACEARNNELRLENDGQRTEISMLLRRNEELQSLNVTLQERVRELEAHHKPHHPQPAPDPTHGNTDDEKVENKIRDFIREHPDFPVEVERTKPLWYQFSGPIRNKVNFKVQGEQVLAHVGGGYVECTSWLTEKRQEFLKAEGILLDEERQNAPSAGLKGRALGSRTSVKRGSSQSRNTAKGR